MNPNTSDIRIQLAVEIMRRNFASDLPWSEIASRVGLSQSRLRHLFTAQTGLSPQQVFAQLRLTQAKELLATTELTIEQVALRVGWQDRSHFERRFKQRYGITPAQHRMMDRTTSLIGQISASQVGHRIANLAIK